MSKLHTMQEPIPAFDPKPIVALRPDVELLGYEVTFSCGHTVWFAVEPATEKPFYPCSVCADLYVRSLR